MLKDYYAQTQAVRHLMTAALAVFWLSGSAAAQGWEPVEEPSQRYLAGKNMVGGRLGPWLADGLTESIETETVKVSSSSVAFHIEFFYEYNLAGPLYLDVNFGAVSRGDIRVETESQNGYFSAIGSAGVYPFGIGLKIYPLAANRTLSLQPFVSAGGSLLVGTETLSFIGGDNVVGNYVGYGSESREALGWYGGGGVTWILGQSFALSFLGKYQHAKFSEELVGQKDFSGVQILVGGAYLYD